LKSNHTIWGKRSNGGWLVLDYTNYSSAAVSSSGGDVSTSSVAAMAAAAGTTLSMVTTAEYSTSMRNLHQEDQSVFTLAAQPAPAGRILSFEALLS